MFARNRKISLDEPAEKILLKVQFVFAQSLKQLITFELFPLKYFSAHVECSFHNPAYLFALNQKKNYRESKL